jgi:chaperone modulatory protein CbpM
MGDRKKSVTTVELLEVDVEFTLSEMCHACGVESVEVVKLVDEGVLEPTGSNRNRWRFPGVSLQRARKALRLQQDLGVNAAGAALALELIDELDRLRTEMKRYAQENPADNESF